MTARARGDRTITLDPYPFDDPLLHLSVPSRVIPDRDYAGEEDVRAALAEAREDRLEFSMASPS